jgi:hypothetical protein
VRGSPIRKSSDQRSVDSSPRLIAASYVLHRLLVPRHPPCALNNLTTHNNTHTHPPPPTHTPRHGRRSRTSAGIQTTHKQTKLARCSRPLCSSQSTDDHPPTPTTRPGLSIPRYDGQAGAPEDTPHPHHLSGGRRGPVPSGPNSVPTTSHPTPPRSTPRIREGHQAVLAAGAEHPAELVSVPPSSSTTNTRRRSELEPRSRSARGSGPPHRGEPRLVAASAP